MIGTLVTVLVVVVAGARLGDGLRLQQQQLILNKLPPPAAAAYFQVLRRRARGVRIMRAISLLSLLALVYAYRNGLLGVVGVGAQ